MQLICNTSFARLHERRLFTCALARTAHQEMVGSIPTGSLKARTARVLETFCVIGSTPISPNLRGISSVGRAKEKGALFWQKIRTATN